MKNDWMNRAKFDRPATLDEVRMATLLQSEEGIFLAGPNDYYCDVISENGERSRMLWFDLEFFSESESNTAPTLN